MLAKDVTYTHKINELKLDFTHPNSKDKIYVLLEGPTDVRLFRKFFNTKSSKVESIPGGKPKLVEALVELSPIRKGILGIRDSDFLNLEGKKSGYDNLFLTDFHDIEMMMIAIDEIFSDIIIEYSNIPQEKHSNIRMNILKAIAFIGYVKWYNEINNLEFNFKGTRFSDVIDHSNFSLKEDKYLSKLLSQSPNAKRTDVVLIKEEINKLKNAAFDLLQLCNGHDFMIALNIYLQKKGDAKNVAGENTFSSIFRIKYSKEHFEKSNLCKEIQNWSVKEGVTIF